MDNLKRTHAPHVRAENSAQRIMSDVLIALIPATAAGIVLMGYRAAILIFVCIASAILAEAAWQIACRKKITTFDLSATVTGLLLALLLPVTLPFWIAAIGSAFAIIIVKQFFGGLGCNFANPALSGVAFLFFSWTAAMTRWTAPFTPLAINNNADVALNATPLEMFAEGSEILPEYLDLLLGNVAGTIGETASFALILGAIYLIVRKIINWKIPAIFIATVAAGTFIFGGETGFFTGDPLFHVLAGSLLLGSIFMATDPVTTPLTSFGQGIFALGCGILTVVIRLWGGQPDGVIFAILLMNALTPLIDKISRPRRFAKPKKEATHHA